MDPTTEVDDVVISSFVAAADDDPRTGDDSVLANALRRVADTRSAPDGDTVAAFQNYA